MAKKRLIPFRFMPGSWGLRGPAFDEAEAHYELEGEALERRLADIRNGDDDKARRRAVLALDRKYGRIDEAEYRQRLLALDGKQDDPRAQAAMARDLGVLDEYDYALRLIEIDCPEDGVERRLAVLALDLKHGVIDQNVHDREAATLRGEPWIGIVSQHFDPSQGVNGVAFEFDWNPLWIEALREAGYDALNDETMVEQWLADSLNTHASADPDAGMLVPLNNRLAEVVSGRFRF